jgi:hypothetical protein
MAWGSTSPRAARNTWPGGFVRTVGKVASTATPFWRQSKMTQGSSSRFAGVPGDAARRRPAPRRNRHVAPAVLAIQKRGAFAPPRLAFATAPPAAFGGLASLAARELAGGINDVTSFPVHRLGVWGMSATPTRLVPPRARASTAAERGAQARVPRLGAPTGQNPAPPRAVSSRQVHRLGVWGMSATPTRLVPPRARASTAAERGARARVPRLGAPTGTKPALVLATRGRVSACGGG